MLLYCVGDKLGHMSLASCYNHGKGVKQNFEKMFEHHKLAAENGNLTSSLSVSLDYNPHCLCIGIVAAIHNLGTQYFAGKGVTADFNKAAEYFQKASDMGFTLSQVNYHKQCDLLVYL